MRVFQVMWSIVGIALVVLVFRFAMQLESLFRTWILTLFVFLIPWCLYWVRRAILPVGTFKDRWLLAFKWLPTGLILLSGLSFVQEGLGLDPEFGMTPALFYLVLASPCLLLASIFRARTTARS